MRHPLPERPVAQRDFLAGHRPGRPLAQLGVGLAIQDGPKRVRDRLGVAMPTPHERAGRTSAHAVAAVVQQRLDQRFDAIGREATIGLAAGARQRVKRRFAQRALGLLGDVPAFLKRESR